MMPKLQQPLNNTQLYQVQERQMFHARIRIKIPLACSPHLFADLYDLLAETDRTYNSYSEGSYFDRINKNAGTFVDVDDETVGLLEATKLVSEFTNGAFDITLMPLIRLWGFYKQQVVRIPTEKEIRRTLQLVDYRNIEIEGNRVRIARGQEIITGSFIKAFAVDRLAKKLKREGITDAMINAGGSTILCFNDETHPVWQIKVPDPADRSNILYLLKVGNGCFSTSAQDIGYIEAEGKRFGHILDARTGYPTSNKQSGIVSSRCLTGDLLSNALLLTEAGKCAEKLEQFQTSFNVNGFLVDAGNQVYTNKLFEERIQAL